MVKTELYFGRDIGKEGYVTDEQWLDFVIDVISMKFDGFTILDGIGVWKGASEECKVVVFLHVGTGDTRANIDNIREEYRQRFGQKEVLRVDIDVSASF